MLGLRRFVLKAFGFLSFLSLASLAGFAMGLIRLASSEHVSRLRLLPTLLMIGSAALFAVVYGVAWWSVKTAKSYARWWAIAASAAMVLTGALLLLLIAVQEINPSPRIVHLPPGVLIEFSLINLMFVGGGTGGLIAFSRYDENAAPVVPKKAPRIAGDGTSSFLDFIGIGLTVIGYFIGENLWFHWAREQGLPLGRGGSIWLLLLFAILTDVLFHECGHASIGMLLGMKLRAFIVGPFQFRVRDGRWNFQFLPGKAFSGGGAAALVPTDPNQPMWCELSMIAAGPVFSLMTGLAGAVLTQSIVGTQYANAWHFFALVSTFGFISFVVNLLPLRPDAFYSDGARIYQLISGGQWADWHRAMSIVASTGVTPLRPRNYDIEAIERTSVWLTTGRQALLLRLLAVSYYFDSGRSTEALPPLAEAERIYDESASDVPAELHTAFVFDTAFLRRDAAAARKWWDRMEAKKPTHFGVDYWLSSSALAWIEGRRDAAEAAWKKGNALAEKLPTAGTYMFDRDRYAELRRAMDEPMARAAATAQVEVLTS